MGPLPARQAPCTPFCPVYPPSPLCTCLQAVPNPTSLPRRAPWALTRTCPPRPGLSLLLIYCPHTYFSLTSVSSLLRARFPQPGAALWDPPSTSILGERDTVWTHTGLWGNKVFWPHSWLWWTVYNSFWIPSTKPVLRWLKTRKTNQGSMSVLPPNSRPGKISSAAGQSHSQGQASCPLLSIRAATGTQGTWGYAWKIKAENGQCCGKG